MIGESRTLNNSDRKLIALEGPEATGKTTISKRIAEDSKYSDLFSWTKEPGSEHVDTTSDIKELIIDDDLNFYNISELLLFIADRYEHYKNFIQDELNNGNHVICDRHALSSLVYQCMACYNNDESEKIEDAIDIFFDIHNTLDIQLPDLTIIIDVPYSVTIDRLQSQNDSELDKIESRNETYHRRVRRSFLYAHRHNLYPNTRIVDGKMSVEACYKESLSIINRFLSGDKL